MRRRNATSSVARCLTSLACNRLVFFLSCCMKRIGFILTSGSVGTNNWEGFLGATLDVEEMPDDGHVHVAAE